MAEDNAQDAAAAAEESATSASAAVEAAEAVAGKPAAKKSTPRKKKARVETYVTTHADGTRVQVTRNIDTGEREAKIL
ncbi:hypothetical protein [Tomitella gaofuii]|uniref:hypothetical protein n=1 Tax=Tomitella gaofuii TaxID=2760083 RepID=UPI0015F9EFDA|nr:hypothetical protein [Tomitella gaofuii]